MISFVGSYLTLYKFDQIIGNCLTQFQLAPIGCVMRLAILQGADACFENGFRRGEIRFADTERDDILHGCGDIEKFANARGL